MEGKLHMNYREEVLVALHRDFPTISGWSFRRKTGIGERESRGVSLGPRTWRKLSAGYVMSEPHSELLLGFASELGT